MQNKYYIECMYINLPENEMRENYGNLLNFPRNCFYLFFYILDFFINIYILCIIQKQENPPKTTIIIPLFP